jgi:predicted GNAT superfamily acetyltransferase
MPFVIRDFALQDLAAVLSLNEASVPAVNSVTAEQMQWFAEHAAYFRIAGDGQRLAAFLIGLRPGVHYDSPNYRWFCRHYDDFGYIDRIAVAGHARRNGLGTKLYDDFRLSLPARTSVMTCEVNLRPANEKSMQFHARMGFRQVASQATDGGSKEVALMERRL